MEMINNAMYKEFKDSINHGKNLDNMSKEERLVYYHYCIYMFQKRKRIENELEQNQNYESMILTMTKKETLSESFMTFLYEILHVMSLKTFHYIGCICFIILTFCFIKVGGFYDNEMINIFLSLLLIPFTIMSSFIPTLNEHTPLNTCITLYREEGMIGVMRIIISYCCGIFILLMITFLIYHVCYQIKVHQDKDLLKKIAIRKEEILKKYKENQCCLLELEKGYSKKYDQSEILFNEKGIEILIQIESMNLFTYAESLKLAYEKVEKN